MKPSTTIIIGGGIIGLATAFRLAAKGAQVTIVERNTCGAESSWAGGGILSPLMPWQYAPEVNALCNAGIARYADWVAEIQTCSGIDPEYWVSGMHVLAPFDKAAAQVWCEANNWQYKLDDSELWLPDVAQVRNPRLIKSLRAAVLARGVRLVENTEIINIDIANNCVKSITTQKGKLFADTFITCAGAWSQQVLASTPPIKTIKPMRGQMVLFKAPVGTLQSVMYQQGVYLIPRLDGHILVGSTVEDVGFDKATDSKTREQLATAAFAMLPALRNAEFIQHWSGLRPGSPDNIPTIARHPEIANLYVNAGHFRYGVTMAPISADLIAELISGHTLSMDISAYQWRE
ncbi:FAD-dependent oxidoreductase [Sulfuriferula nivalis]|uniref:Glycine oxidase ThiO n=1 Tax=Sulfuriferula nivalis TaxID=2675298 RepID=A0A809S392_9PROT|nr:FAD-dependent oxidoreductase [Sulfuriferula nivalis]BBP01208.1 glycine oxidase ThiO [Sulfuriferula nivalis]